MTTGVLLTALGLVLRVFAVALPGVIVFATTDPTDLADALIQNAKAPARFAIGALAAFRLVPLLGQEWQMISMARRARGVDAGRNPVAKLRLFASTAFALLVGAIRRGTRLAVAMDARGFDAGTPRTVARQQHFTRADVLLIAGAVVLAAAALTTSVAPRHLPPPDQLSPPRVPPAARARRLPPAARSARCPRPLPAARSAQHQGCSGLAGEGGHYIPDVAVTTERPRPAPPALPPSRRPRSPRRSCGFCR